jgi:hypothetical protein
MGVSKFLTGMMAVFAVSAVSAGPRAAAAEQCVLGSKYPVSSIAPYRTNDNTGGYGGGYDPVLRGADINVPAQPGLTAEWLDRQVEEQVASGDCQFGLDANAVGVDVLPMGADFVVRVTNTNYRFASHDARGGKEILRKADDLAR